MACFVEITNEDIYTKLCSLEKKFNDTKTKLKVNSWMSTTALSLVIIVIGVLLSPLAAGVLL